MFHIFIFLLLQQTQHVSIFVFGDFVFDEVPALEVTDQLHFSYLLFVVLHHLDYLETLIRVVHFLVACVLSHVINAEITSFSTLFH